jgi:hypothetical protein
LMWQGQGKGRPLEFEAKRLENHVCCRSHLTLAHMG